MMPYTWMSIRVMARFHDFVSTSYSFPSRVPAQMYLPSRVSECLPAACAAHLAVAEIARAETSPKGPFVKTGIKLPSELLNLLYSEHSPSDSSVPALHEWISWRAGTARRSPTTCT